MLRVVWSRLNYFIRDFSLYLVLITLSLLILGFFLFKIYKSDLAEKKKRIFLMLLFTVLTIVLVTSSIEAYFRYVYDQSDGLGFLKVNSRWHKRHVVTNNYFFRDRDFVVQKPEGTARIGVIGDSITFGGGIKNPEERFSNLLEQKLRSSGAKAEVYNLGKLGTDTEVQIREYQKVKHLDFDIIIWQYFLNDIQPFEKSTGTPIISRNSQTGKIVSFFSEKSYFFDFLFWRYSQRYKNTFEKLKNADLAQYQNQQVKKKHKEDIAGFISDLARENKKIVVIIFPFIHLVGQNYPAENIHEEMGNFFKANGAQVVDLLPYLKNKDPKHFVAGRFDPHPNEIVHGLAAQKLFELISPYLTSPLRQ